MFIDKLMLQRFIHQATMKCSGVWGLFDIVAKVCKYNIM